MREKLKFSPQIQVSDTIIPHQILQFYNKLLQKSHTSDWKRKKEQDLWHELCFCILSGNVTFELAKSVIDTLNEKELLDQYWIVEDPKSLKVLNEALEESQFLPLKNNGELRKYRYPNKRSQQIVKAAQVIYSENKSIKHILSQFESDIETRSYLSNQISGLGIKEASHFLRNIHYSNSLAIIDVHVLSFLKKNYLISQDMSVTPNSYLKLERILRNLADFHGLDLSIFDLAIWHYMRRLFQ